MKLFDTLYRLGLRLLPRAFRDEHGRDAARMAAARVAEESGAKRLTRAARELADLVMAAPRIRRDAAAQGTPFTRPSSGNGARMFAGFSADLRHAARSLARTRGFLTVALTTLGAAIALCASTAVLVNAYLVRGLPYPESDRLYWIRLGQPNLPPIQNLETIDWSALDDIVEHPISWDLDLFNMRGAPYPEAAQGTWVTRGYMEGFGIHPALGRAFLPSDFDPGAQQVALISHGLWQSRFAGDPGILGRTFDTYNNDRPNEPQTFTIVGVLPRDLWHLNAFTEIMAPLRAPSFPYMARLRKGVTAETALARIDALVKTSGLALPQGWNVGIESAHAIYVAEIRPVLVALGAATLLMMLIACANVAVLFTVRATERRREVGVRRALGASTARIARALSAEALIVGAAATVIGAALTQLVIVATARLVDTYLGRTPGGIDALRIDGVTLLVMAAAGVLVTLVCGAAQLWTARAGSTTTGVAGSHRGATGSRQQRRAQSVLIAVEIAACLALLASAALMVRSGLRILDVDMGLRAESVLTASVTFNRAVYPDAPARVAIYDRVTEAITSLDSVRGLAFATFWPLQEPPPREVGRDEPGGALSTRAGVVAVSSSYFDTLDTALEDGRAFTDRDRLGSEPVVIVSRTLASALWPGARAVGQRMLIASPQPDGLPAPYTVVGVAADSRQSHADIQLSDAYLPMLQYPSPSPFVYIRAAGDMARVQRDVRQALAGVDPDMALARPRPLADILNQQRVRTRFLTTLFTVFAFVATMLALVGVYGVIAYTVRQREREIAVRIAIGADRPSITRLFLRQGAVVLAMGSLAGVAAAIALGRLLESQLFGVQPADPWSIGFVTVGFALCGLVAIAWPARAAASTDPALALKD